MKKLLITLLAATAAIPAFAFNFYVGGQGGLANNSFSFEKTIYNPRGSDIVITTDYSATGYNFGLIAGYQFNKYLGTEFGLTYVTLGSLNLKSGPSTSISNDNSATAPIYDLAITGSYPFLNDKIIPFVKFGVAVETHATGYLSDEAGLLYAGGGAYKIAPQLAANINLQYISFSSSTPSSFLLTGAGLTYSFK